MGFGLGSSNGQYTTFSGCTISILPDVMIEQFLNMLKNKKIKELPVLDEWRDRLLDVYGDRYEDFLPKNEDNVDNINLSDFIEKIFGKEQTIQQLVNHRIQYERNYYFYELKDVQKLLCQVADCIYALHLGGIFTAINVACRLNNIISHHECQELLDTLNVLKSIDASDCEDNDLCNRFILIFSDALKTPHGFVTFS